MPVWLQWLLLTLGLWVAIAIVVALAAGRSLRLLGRGDAGRFGPAGRPDMASERLQARRPGRAPERPRILVVDDDASFRALIVATLAGHAADVVEAETATQAREVVESLKPTLVLLDVSLPDANGLVFCAELQEREEAPKVVLLTGAQITEEAARSAGAELALTKPFSPLELLAVIERLTAPAAPSMPLPTRPREVLEDPEQLLVYARDLARVIEIERAQRQLIENAYRQTMSALASALEARDTGTNIHSLRVTRYALELAGHAAPELLEDPTVVYGFLLHDIGKIGITDRILLKPGPLNASEWQEMRRHPEIGETILGGVAILQGEGVAIVRSHHERWDGSGYPDGIAEQAIPRGARIFAVADALDALTSDRPYRAAGSWEAAFKEITRGAGGQFDPEAVEALVDGERSFRAIREEMARAA